MRFVPVTMILAVLLTSSASALPQKPSSNSQESKDLAAGVSKQDADAEAQLQKAIADAGNDRAALVRNLRNYLLRFPDAPRKAGVYRALVESCQPLQDTACALEYAEKLVAVHPDDSEMMLLAIGLLQQQGSDASLTRAAGYATRVLDRIEKATPEEKSARVPVKDDYPKAVDEYLLAFVLPEEGPAGKVDRREVRKKLGNVWRQVHGSEQGLGEQILVTYDHLGATSANLNPPARNKGAKDSFSFVLRNLDGSPLPLAPLKGKVVVLSFWATWCGPCRELEPEFVQIAKNYTGNTNLAFYAVNTDEDETLVPGFVSKEKWDVPVVFADGLDDFMNVTGLPTVIIFDRAGKIAFRMDGFPTKGFA